MVSRTSVGVDTDRIGASKVSSARAQRVATFVPRAFVAAGLIVALVAGLGLATWSQTPVPEVELDMPDFVSIGEDFEFTVKFRNATPNTIGDGPFIDLFAEYLGIDCTDEVTSGVPGPCDGIEILSAELVLSSPPSYALPPVNPQIELVPLATPTTSTCPSGLCLTGSAYLSHPFDAVPTYPSGLGLDGFQAFVIRLPFNGYSGDAIDAEIKVKARVHEYADHGAQLCIYARGGFKNGANTPLLSGTVAACIPTGAFSVTKSHAPIDCDCSCTHCADETVTGPHYPSTYSIDIHVAANQTLEELFLRDELPAEIQYIPNSLVVSPLGTGYVPVELPNGSEPGGLVELVWPVLDQSVTVEYSFFIPEQDASGNPIVWEGCEPESAHNVVVAEAYWLPLDPRDLDECGGPCHLVDNSEHDLEMKCIALQKTVELSTDINHPSVTPDDQLTYKLDFQISDYTSFRGIEVVDHLSDGQTYLGGATLHIEDPGLGTHDIPLDDYLELDPSPFAYPCPVAGGTCGSAPYASIAVGTVLVFHVHDAMNDLIGSDVLTGVPDPAAPATTGRITYSVSVDDVFEDHWYHKGGLYAGQSDAEVDKLDPLLNCAYIRGEQLEPVSSTADDGSYTCARVTGDSLAKSIYRVYRPGASQPLIYENTNPDAWSCPKDVFPGDLVTYRIYKVIPSCDAEYLAITDWLPLDVFDVSPSDWSYDSSGPSTQAPSVNEWKLGPDHSTYPPAPTFSSPSVNELHFNYGSIVDTGANTQCTVDLLFTVEVTGHPLPDETLVVNTAQECESITYSSGCSGGSCPGTGSTFCQMAIAAFTLREPELHITKGVVIASPWENPSIPGYGTFVPATPGPVPFSFPCETAPGEPAFLQPIVSQDLQFLPVDSDLYDVDANDVMKFAVVVENLGGAPAYDVVIADDFPDTCFEAPSCGLNLAVTDGAGDPFACNPVSPSLCAPSDFFDPGTGIQLVDPGPTAVDPGAIDGYSDDSGRNIAVITYDLRLRQDVSIGQCCANTAELVHYASVDGGDNFVGQDLVDPTEEEDDARVCLLPDASKCIIATSETHTTPQEGTSVAATIGEIVRYRLILELPEEQYPYLLVRDYLDDGMEYIDGSATCAFFYDNAMVAPNISVTQPQALPTGGCLADFSQVVWESIEPELFSISSFPLEFDIGGIWNQDDDPDSEYLVIEYCAIVANTGSNQDGDPLTNLFKAVTGSGSAIAVSNTATVWIVEPELDVSKHATYIDTDSDGCPDTWQFDVTVENTGSSTAFDIAVQDIPLPSGSWSLPSAFQCSNPLVMGDLTNWPTSYGWKVPTLAPGDSETCQLVMKLGDECCNAVNKAQATCTSLPGLQGTMQNPTGFHAGTAGSLMGERTSYFGSYDLPLCGKVTGKKLGDHDGDGVFDGQEDWEIAATGPGSSGCIQTTSTDTNGEYEFCLAPGTYTISETLQPGWTAVGPTSYTVNVAAGLTPEVDFKNEAGQTCSCAVTFGFVDYNGVVQTAKCNMNDVVTVTMQSSTDVVSISTDAVCTPPVWPCQASYHWTILDSDALTVYTATTPQITFDPPGSDTYEVTLKHYCAAVECRCAFHLVVNEPTGCNCGQWDSVTVTGPDYTGLPVQSNSVIGAEDGSTLTVTADYSCFPGSCPVSSYGYKLSYGTGTQTTGVVTADPAQFSFGVNVSSSPIVVDITPTCGGQDCTKYSFTVYGVFNKGSTSAADCIAQAAFTLNGSSEPFIQIGAEEELILDGSLSTCVSNYFVTVQQSDRNWSQIGPRAERYLSPSEIARIDQFDVRLFAAYRGLTMEPGKYYRIVLGVGHPWHDMTKLVYIRE